MKRLVIAVSLVVAAAPPGYASAQNVFLSPITVTNPVAGNCTETEADYALINANIASAMLQAAGFSTQVVAGPVSTSTSAAVDAANDRPAAIFVSIASNASGNVPHGPWEYYYTDSTNGLALAKDIQQGLLSQYTLTNNGETGNTTWDVLYRTKMPAVVSFPVFHDCTTSHPTLPSSETEAAFLCSSVGQCLIGTGIVAGICTYFGAAAGSASSTRPVPPASRASAHRGRASA